MSSGRKKRLKQIMEQERAQKKSERKASQLSPGGGSDYAKKVRRQEEEYFEKLNEGEIDSNGYAHDDPHGLIEPD